LFHEIHLHFQLTISKSFLDLNELDNLSHMLSQREIYSIHISTQTTSRTRSGKNKVDSASPMGSQWIIDLPKTLFFLFSSVATQWWSSFSIRTIQEGIKVFLKMFLFCCVVWKRFHVLHKPVKRKFLFRFCNLINVSRPHPSN